MHDWQLPKVIWCARHTTVTVQIAVAPPSSQSASISIGKHGVKHMAIAPKEIWFFFKCGPEMCETIQSQKCPLGVWDTKKSDSPWKHIISHCTSFQCLDSNWKALRLPSSICSDTSMIMDRCLRWWIQGLRSGRVEDSAAELLRGIADTNVSRDNDSLTATDSYARAVILQTCFTE